VFVVLSVLLAVGCLIPGVAKVVGHPKMQAAAGHFGIPFGLYRLIGTAEVAAAAGVLAGLVWAPLGVAAASGMVLLLAGALLAHSRARDGFKQTTLAFVVLGVSLAYLAAAFVR
jgi:hypothetical protein